MRDDIRVRRDWIDVRHEYLQADGVWRAGACTKPGFCRECNVTGEHDPRQVLARAFERGRTIDSSVRFILAANLHIHLALVADEMPIEATPFRRLWIAHYIEQVTALQIADEAILAARNVGDVMRLAAAPEMDR